jgi:type IV pilus assembly protein PilY1
LLGAIVNSPPVFAGPPSASILEPGYQSFYQRYQRRTPAVFAGADDGMLHAFNVDSGSELFAYVPRMLFPALVQLTRPDSVRRAFVDGPIRIAEAHLGSEWKTVLVAAMRGGAQGVFALDVTDPAHFDEGAGVLWEFSDADDPHMGNVIGTPAIAKLYIGTRKGLRSYRYFAIVTAGLNNYVDDGTGRFEPGAANALFLLALDKPPAEKWKAGSNYVKLVLPVGESNSANGLSEPALVIDGDGVLRHVYVGDLQGNIWRFDFTGALPWTNAMGTGMPKPLFTASDEQGNRQPITAKPAIVFTRAGYLILFGTGRLLESRDLIDARTQSFYAVQDDPYRRSDTVRRSQLARRNAMARADGSIEISGSVSPSGKDLKGWYIDLPEPGERVLRTADIAGHMAYFDTLRPSADPCRNAIARSYVVDTLSGLPPDNVVTGIPFDPQGDDGTVVLPPEVSSIAPRDASGKRKVEIRRIRIDTETKTGVAGAKDRAASTQTMTTGRLSWRELVDWNGRQK